MSEASLDLREQLTRIDRSIAETEKFQQETRKFVSEARKVDAEGRKLDRDRWLAPWAVSLTAAAALGGVARQTIGARVILKHIARNTQQGELVSQTANRRTPGTVLGDSR